MSGRRRIPNSIFGSGGGVATTAPNANTSVGGYNNAAAAGGDRRSQPPPVRELTDEQRQEIKEAVSVTLVCCLFLEVVIESIGGVQGPFAVWRQPIALCEAEQRFLLAYFSGRRTISHE